jgi:GNAT superfamily N-acetyltransferase
VSSETALQRVTLDAGGIAAALRLSDAAGWNQTAEDWSAFVAYGTVFGVLGDGGLVATAAVIPYGAEFGWIAMVLVTADYRRRGIASCLLDDCVASLRRDGRAAFLDASDQGAPLYAARGFVRCGGLTRWAGVGAGEAAGSNAVPFALDRAAFGADRGFLLDHFLARPGACAFAEPEAYAVLRPGRRAWHIGPVIGAHAAGARVLDRAIRAAPGPVVIDLPDAGAALQPMLSASAFRPVRRWQRMALDVPALPGDPARTLAAAGPEFG